MNDEAKNSETQSTSKEDPKPPEGYLPGLGPGSSAYLKNQLEKAEPPVDPQDTSFVDTVDVQDTREIKVDESLDEQDNDLIHLDTVDGDSETPANINLQSVHPATASYSVPKELSTDVSEPTQGMDPVELRKRVDFETGPVIVGKPDFKVATDGPDLDSEKKKQIIDTYRETGTITDIKRRAKEVKKNLSTKE